MSHNGIARKVNNSVTPELEELQRSAINELNKLEIMTWITYSIVESEVDNLCRYNSKYLVIDLIGFLGL